MISERRKRATLPWIATAFCAALSLLTICQNLWLSVVNHSDYGGWAIGFLCFLPICFYWVGVAMSKMQREISELRKQVAELQRDNGRELG